MPLTEAVQNPIVAKFDLVEQGHGSLIALLANAVNRRGQRYLLKNHRLPTVELSAMLGGFAWSLERNRLRRRQTGAIPDVVLHLIVRFCPQQFQQDSVALNLRIGT